MAYEDPIHGVVPKDIIEIIMADQQYIEDILKEWPEHLAELGGRHELVVASLAVQLHIRENATAHKLAQLFAIAVGMLARERSRRT